MKEESQKGFPIWSLLLGILTIVFITLKLTGFIEWGWIWVLCPLWLPILSVIGIWLIIFLIGLISIGIKEIIKAVKK